MDVPTFGGSPLHLGTSNASAITATKSVSWYGPVTIDAGSSSGGFLWDVNSDESASCQSWSTLNKRGCTQPPATIYSDNRWITGFTQNYLYTGSTLVSAFANMTSLTTGFFGALGSGLGIIDSGLVYSQSPASSRYVRMASFPNGDVVAVYFVDNQADSLRTVYASIYSARTHAWSAATQISGGTKVTDFASDYAIGSSYNVALNCRPSVATSGDGSAMVTWCESRSCAAPPCAATDSEIMYNQYLNGSWQGATELITVAGSPTPSNWALPGFNGVYQMMSADLLGSTTVPPNPGGLTCPCASGTLPNCSKCQTLPVPSGGQEVNLSVGDLFQQGIFLTSAGLWPNALVQGVSGTPGIYFTTPPFAQYQVVTNSSGIVQVCPTLKNMVQALLSAPAFDANPANTTYKQTLYTTAPFQYATLPYYGVSIQVDPTCQQTGNANNDSGTWNIVTYFNRGGKNVFFDEFATYDYSVGAMIRTPAGGTQGGDTVVGITPYGSFANPNKWWQSAAADLSGDGFGNYALVRSVAATYLKASDISSATGAGVGRMLVGHEYVAGSGWRLAPKGSGANSATQTLATGFVSRTPICDNDYLANFPPPPGATMPLQGALFANPPLTVGGETIPCSARDPKFLMSDSGIGLIVYHQNQPISYAISSAGYLSNNPNRIWYSTYGTASGYSLGGILDPDVICSGSSFANDQPVCETASYDAVGSYTPSSKLVRFAPNCQVLGEPQAMSLPGTPVTTLTHDVPPIAAAMNHAGQAVVAFNKTGYTASTCGHIGTWVALFDPVNGFGNVTQIDDQVGDSMHAQAAISRTGTAAVVWDERVGTSTYVYLRVYSGGSWSSQTLMNPGLTSPADSMMPGVGINEKGEITVTYTYGPVGGARRQYAMQFFYH